MPGMDEAPGSNLSTIKEQNGQTKTKNKIPQTKRIAQCDSM